MSDLFSKILVFDLDDTLINTRAIKDVLFDFALGLKIGAEQIQGIYRQIRDSGFTLEKYAAALSGTMHKPADEIASRLREKIIENKVILLPVETVDFLELCRERGVTMKLLTFGAPSWQAEKIRMLGLDKYFHDHIATDNEATGKLEEMAQIVAEAGSDRQIMLFNDKLTEIVDILERYPKMTAYLRPVRPVDGELLKKIDPTLRRRIEVLPSFRFLMSEVYDGVKK